LKDSSTLRDRAFFHNLAPISGQSDADLRENFTTNVTLDKEVPVEFWKSPGSEIGIRSPNPDQIRFGGGLRSPSATKHNSSTQAAHGL